MRLTSFSSSYSLRTSSPNLIPALTPSFEAATPDLEALAWAYFLGEAAGRGVLFRHGGFDMEEPEMAAPPHAGERRLGGVPVHLLAKAAREAGALTWHTLRGHVAAAFEHERFVGRRGVEARVGCDRLGGGPGEAGGDPARGSHDELVVGVPGVVGVGRWPAHVCRPRDENRA